MAHQSECYTCKRLNGSNVHTAGVAGFAMSFPSDTEVRRSMSDVVHANNVYGHPQFEHWFNDLQVQ